jgi:hypothetical protein
MAAGAEATGVVVMVAAATAVEVTAAADPDRWSTG